MKKFTVHKGVAAPIIRLNIDTDAIIPSREMKLVSKDGLGEGLFAGWRYTLPGSREPNPEFVLNKPQYQDASILLSGANFGCGSSREHAVWALKEFGFRAIIAVSFGAIFYGNCVRNGILPIVLSEYAIAKLAEFIEEDPQVNQITVDLENQFVAISDDEHFAFDIEPSLREMLMEGLDFIAVTLKHDDEIQAFEREYQARRPWVV